MQHRRLGRTGLTVSEVGYGAWGLGQTMWRGVDDAEGADALRAALDEGVTFLDTALAYGDGHSERVIGGVLAGRGGGTAAAVAVATKIPPKDWVWPGDGRKALADVFPPSWVRTCTETSLRNLGVDGLDLQQFHVWHDAWLDDPSWDGTRAMMERLVREGKVRHWGVSINDHAPETALRLCSDPLVETAQVIYNLFDRSPERELFARARERDLGIIVRVPFDEGALTGAITPETAFPEGDWRHRYFRGDRPAQLQPRVAALRELVGGEAATLPELALRFCLAPPEVSTVIPGMRRPAHARANAAVSDGRRLSPGLLERLAAHAWDKNWYGA